MATDIVTAVFMVAKEIVRIVQQNKEVAQECHVRYLFVFHFLSRY